MKRACIVMAMTAVVSLLSGTPASADEGEVKALQGEVQALRSEVAEIKSTLEQMNKQLDTSMKRVLSELAAVKKGQAAAPRRKREPDTTVYKIDVSGSPYLGPEDAKVTIVEFSEFQCPFCIREDPKIKQILKEYPNDVRLVFKHFPLSFHKRAKPAAGATLLAYKELGNDGFWKMHDKIVAGGTKKLDDATLRGYAEELGMNLQAFDAVMKDESKIDEMLKPDLQEAAKCKVRGTPTILINGLKLADRSAAGYKARIDQILKGVETAKK